MTSLHLLAPSYPSQPHRRRLSNATFTTSDGATDVDHNLDLHPLKSTTTSVVSASPTHVGSGSDIGDNDTTRSERSSKGKAKARSNQKDATRDEHADEHNPSFSLDITQDANIDPTPFAFKPFALASLVDPKNLDALEDMGGINILLRGLGTNRLRGLPHKGAGEGVSQRHDRSLDPDPEEIQVVVTRPEGDEERRPDPEDSNKAFSATLETRQRIYGKNVLPERMSKTLLQLMWLAMKDKVLILLSIAAVVSLALGFFQDFGPARVPGQPPVDWVEGVAIVVAILIVVLVGSVNDYQKEQQFKVLNEKKEERGVKVIRGGAEMIIDIKDVLVGDIALLEPGEIIPCDGVFLSGHNVKCDESGSTGESDAIKKVPFHECISLRNLAKEKGATGGEEAFHGHSSHTDCFMISGSKVLEGYGKYVVIAVGIKSFNGRIMMALRGDTENTPLQIKLNTLAELIAKVGSLAGLLLFTALMIRFFVQLGTGNPSRTPNQNGIAFVNILIISVTLVVVAVPEGLPLAITLALSFATKRMTAENLLVRVLGSCETMANASVVCTDKTGTLTQNSMTVVAGCVGIHAKFIRNLKENEARTNASDQHPESSLAKSQDTEFAMRRQQSLVRKHTDDFSLEQGELDTALSPQLATLFNEAITINSTAFEDIDPDTGHPRFVGSKTETALLTFAQELGWDDYRTVREKADIIQMIPFSSDRKAMGVVVKIRSNKFRLYLKGASEILSKMCTRHVVVVKRPPGVTIESGTEVETKAIDENGRDNLSRTIIFYANQTLRTIAICYRDFDSWPPVGTRFESVDEVSYEDLAKDLTLVGITGIEDPLRPGVRDAVADCAKAGVCIKMCTGDNILTARSIALQCGIYSAGGIIMEGPVFRHLSHKDKLDIVPRLQVLARSSPEDKKILVETLKSLGEIVGVTGDGTNDGPALKTAHVGFSMGIAGTEVAKEASDIILMDDNFSSIVKAIMWGRCVNDAVRKFLQFQLSTNVTAVIITFVTAVSSSHEASVLSAVQLLWINIIMDTFAALALATDPASKALLDRKPDRPTAPLFSVNMIMQILGQSTYQVIIILIFHFLGLEILDLPNNTHNTTIVTTLVFNAFVFAQIFNSINCRRLDNKLNVFEGVLRNWYFIGITLIEIIAQVFIVYFGGAAFQVARFGGREWGISIGLGLVSLPLGAAIRLLPTAPFERFFIKVRLMPNAEIIPMTRTDEWNPAIDLVRDNLWTFSNLRGGRVRGSSFVFKNRKAKLRAQNPAPFSSMMAMVPSLVASSVGAGWAPKNEGLSDPAQDDPSKSSAALWDGKLQFHPDTKPDDPAFIRWGAIAKPV